MPEPEAAGAAYAGFDDWWRVAFAHTSADRFPASEAWREATRAATARADRLEAALRLNLAAWDGLLSGEGVLTGDGWFALRDRAIVEARAALAGDAS